jgi:hypothetical protein
VSCAALNTAARELAAILSASEHLVISPLWLGSHTVVCRRGIASICWVSVGRGCFVCYPKVVECGVRRASRAVYERRWVGGRRALYTHRRGIVAHAMISSQSPGWAGKIRSLVGLARATASGHCYGEICGRGTVCVLSLRPSGRASPASTRCRHIECRYTE